MELQNRCVALPVDVLQAAIGVRACQNRCGGHDLGTAGKVSDDFRFFQALFANVQVDGIDELFDIAIVVDAIAGYVQAQGFTVAVRALQDVIAVVQLDAVQDAPVGQPRYHRALAAIERRWGADEPAVLQVWGFAVVPVERDRHFGRHFEIGGAHEDDEPFARGLQGRGGGAIADGNGAEEQVAQPACHGTQVNQRQDDRNDAADEQGTGGNLRKGQLGLQPHAKVFPEKIGNAVGGDRNEDDAEGEVTEEIFGRVGEEIAQEILFSIHGRPPICEMQSLCNHCRFCFRSRG